MKYVGDCFRNMKIQYKLMLTYLLACVVPVIAISFIIYQFSAHNLEESSVEFATIFSSQIVTNIDDFIEEYDRVTKSALIDCEVINHFNDKDVTVIERINNQIEVKQMMMRMIALKPDIKSVMLLSESGEVYQYSNSGDSVNSKILLEQGWLKHLLEERDAEEKLSVTSVHSTEYYDKRYDNLAITVSRIIYDYTGAFAGVLLIDLDPSGLFELNEDFLLARNNYNIKINVTDTEDGIIYDSDVASGRATWEMILDDKDASLKDKDEKDFIILQNETKRCGIKINTVIPRSDLLFKIKRVNYVTIIAVMLCVLIVSGVSIVLSHMITKPIKNLRTSMRKVEKGDYGQSLGTESHDEIGELVHSYNHMITKIQSLIKDVYLAQIKQKNARYLALQMQINPHMLYNTLEFIRMTALMDGNEEVASMIKTLSHMFRLVLDKKKGPHLIKDEIEYLEYYIKLQNIRYNGQFSLEVDLSTAIMTTEIIALVLQPIVENSIEHGFKGYKTKLEIKISGEMTSDQGVMIRIEDNGQGMTMERVEEIKSKLQFEKEDIMDIKDDDKKSIGLKNIAERIKLHYGNQYFLRFDSEMGRGTVVEIKIPLQK